MTPNTHVNIRPILYKWRLKGLDSADYWLNMTRELEDKINEVLQ